MKGENEVKWRNRYNKAENKVYDQLSMTYFYDDPGKTLQAPAEEQDINVIMKRFGITDGSILPYWNDPRAVYGDFSGMPEGPVEAAELLRQGELEFAKLPADVRRQFDSGAHMYQWLNDENNADKAVELGLLRRLPKPSITLEEVTERLEGALSTNTSSDKE